jgi:hypothetical protein
MLYVRHSVSSTSHWSRLDTFQTIEFRVLGRTGPIEDGRPTEIVNGRLLVVGFRASTGGETPKDGVHLFDGNNADGLEDRMRQALGGQGFLDLAKVL